MATLYGFEISSALKKKKVGTGRSNLKYYTFKMITEPQMQLRYKNDANIDLF